MQNIGVALQTVFDRRFSQAGLDAVALGVVPMLYAIFFPIAGMVFAPVALVVAVIVQVLAFPAIVAAFLLFTFTCVVTADDLTVAETGMGKEFFLAERAPFFFVSSLRMITKRRRRQKRMWICGKVGTKPVDRALPCPQAP